MVRVFSRCPAPLTGASSQKTPLSGVSPLIIKLGTFTKTLTASDCVVVQTAMSVVVLLALPCTLFLRNPPLVAVRPAQKLPPVAMSLTAAAPVLGAAVAASHLCTKVPIEMDR